MIFIFIFTPFLKEKRATCNKIVNDEVNCDDFSHDEGNDADALLLILLLFYNF